MNDQHEDSIIKYLVEKNDTKVNDEVREISIETENEDVIHINITDTETKTNMDTYKEVIYECLDDASTIIM